MADRTGSGKDPERGSLLDQIMIDEGNRSWVMIPLHEDGAIVGVLAFSSRIPGEFQS